MSMAFDVYGPAVVAWIEGQLTADSVTAQFRHQQGGWQGKARARLQFISSRDLGTDELRWATDVGEPAGSDHIPTVNGNRLLTLSILMQTRDQRHDKTARYYLEQLRTSLRKPSVKTALYAAGLAYATSETIQNLDRWVDDRWESQAQMDIHFNAVAIDRDTAEGASYVDTVIHSATIETPAGDDVGWTDEQIPAP